MLVSRELKSAIGVGIPELEPLLASTRQELRRKGIEDFEAKRECEFAALEPGECKLSEIAIGKLNELTEEQHNIEQYRLVPTN